MFSISTVAPTGITASLQCRPHNMIRAPYANVRVICGSPNGSATTYPALGLEIEKGKLEKPQMTERSPIPIPTLADRMRFGGLIKDKLAYKECFVVRSYEVGSNKSATMETILNLIQETSCNHAHSWGWLEGEFPTLPSMKKYRLIWVNYQMHVEMNKYPVWGDVVEIEHWCEPEGRIAARFDYIIKNLSSGEVIGRATSKWLMLNEDTHKPQKINNQVRDELLAFCSKSSRLAFAEENNRGLEKIPQLDEPAQYSQLNLLPRRSDLNMNSHVNSITYFSLLLESMPQDIIDKYELQSITIDYRHHCQFDDSLDSYTSTEIEKEDLNGFSNDSFLLDSNPNPGRYHQFLHSLKLSATGKKQTVVVPFGESNKGKDVK